MLANRVGDTVSMAKNKFRDMKEGVQGTTFNKISSKFSAKGISNLTVANVGAAGVRTSTVLGQVRPVAVAAVCTDEIVIGYPSAKNTQLRCAKLSDLGEAANFNKFSLKFENRLVLRSPAFERSALTLSETNQLLEAAEEFVDRLMDSATPAPGRQIQLNINDGNFALDLKQLDLTSNATFKNMDAAWLNTTPGSKEHKTQVEFAFTQLALESKSYAALALDGLARALVTNKCDDQIVATVVASLLERHSGLLSRGATTAVCQNLTTFLQNPAVCTVIKSLWTTDSAKPARTADEAITQTLEALSKPLMVEGSIIPMGGSIGEAVNGYEQISQSADLTTEQMESHLQLTDVEQLALSY